MAELALGALPNLPTPGTTHSPVRPSWRDMSEEELFDDLEHDGQDTEQAAAEIYIESRARRTDQQRQRYRAWLRRLVDGAADVPLIDQMSRTALVLVGTTLDLWSAPSGPAGWFDLLNDATNHLDLPEPAEAPDELLHALGSLVAACLYRLDEGLPDRRSASEHVTLHDTVSRVAGLVQFATPEGVVARSKLPGALGARHGGRVHRSLHRASTTRRPARRQPASA